MRQRHTTTATGVATIAGGLGLIALGAWARRDVMDGLERERVTAPPNGSASSSPVTDASGARSLAELIRHRTLSAAGGTTYGETPAYVDPDGQPTTDHALAARDGLTGHPLENPNHALWIQSTALQTALMQAYIAQRLAELTIGLGALFVGVGTGLAAAGRR